VYDVVNGYRASWESAPNVELGNGRHCRLDIVLSYYVHEGIARRGYLYALADYNKVSSCYLSVNALFTVQLKQNNSTRSGGVLV